MFKDLERWIEFIYDTHPLLHCISNMVSPPCRRAVSYPWLGIIQISFFSHSLELILNPTWVVSKACPESLKT